MLLTTHCQKVLCSETGQELTLSARQVTPAALGLSFSPEQQITAYASTRQTKEIFLHRKCWGVPAAEHPPESSRLLDCSRGPESKSGWRSWPNTLPRCSF